MTSPSVSVATARPRRFPLRPVLSRRPARSPGPRTIFFHILSAVSASMPLSCAWRWRTPSGLRCRRRMGLEGGLRRVRGRDRPVPSQVRSGHALARGLVGRHAADAGKDRGPASTHTRRSEESEALQQFSTPILLGLRRAPQLRSRPMISCWSRRPAPAARHPGRTVGRVPRSQRTRRNVRSFSRFSFPHRRHPFRRRAYQRSSRRWHHAKRCLMNPPFSAIANVDRRLADAACGI